MNRRNFLKTSGVLTASSLVVPTLTGAAAPALKKGEPVLILGAGLAGLAAAFYLHKKNIPFTILEARNRIGGRVFSHTLKDTGGLQIELGAEWVGTSHERMQSLCKELGLNLLNHQFHTHLTLEGTYFKHGDWTFEKNWADKYQALLVDFKSKNEKDGKLLDNLDWWRYLINQGIPERDLEIRDLLDSTDFGECIRNVSAYAGMSEYAYSSEKNEMDFKIEGGNSRLAEAIVQKIGLANVLLSKKALAVKQDSKGVLVTCEDGTHYTAAHLICTVPVFALHQIQWHPALPKEKQEALNELQYCRIIKSAVVCTERFWQDEAFDMITDTTAHYFFHSSKNQPGIKGSLTSYAVGDRAQIFSKLTQEQKKREICESLRPAFGHVAPYVDSVMSYYWGSDPFSKGAYAIYDTRQWFGVREELAKTCSRVSFAGEHLADWQGFMEGAVQTGEDAAKALAGP